MATEFRLLLRSRLTLAGLMILFAAAGIALWLGHTEMQRQHAEIERAAALQAEQRTHLGYATQDDVAAGSVGYYTFHEVADPPGPWSFLAVGNRQVMPPVQRIRLLGLEAQLYEGESRNPERAVAGAFDFAFVVVFLLPLLAIALAHDLLPGERERGRLGLLQSLAQAERSFWSQRLLARLLLLFASVGLPLIGATLILQRPVTSLLALLVGIGLYTTFWTALAGWIGLRWRNLSSTASAMALLSIWVTLVMIAPTFANAALARSVDADLGGEIALEHRRKVNDAWDLPKSATFEPFFASYPEWRDTAPVTGRFHWKWYYAFHHVADEHVAPKVARYRDALAQRAEATRMLGVVLPSVAMQNLFDGLADNGIDRVLAQRSAIRAFHTRLRHHFYPYLFDDLPFDHSAHAAMPSFEPPQRTPRQDALAWIGLGASGLLALFLVVRSLDRRVRRAAARYALR